MTTFSEDQRLTREAKIEICARVAHEANRAYCESIGDKSQLPWESAPDWQRESCRKGIEGALIGFKPEQQHRAWLDDKLAEGWSLGPVKDPELKTHPCMVPYEDLPPEQKIKDALYGRVVRQVAATLGLIERPFSLDGKAFRIEITNEAGEHLYGMLTDSWNIRELGDGLSLVAAIPNSEDATSKGEPLA